MIRSIPLMLLVLLLAGCRAPDATPTAEPVEPEQQPADRVMAAPPAVADRDDRFLFYLHGRIIEEQGTRPRHPRFGVYEYEAILRSLSESGAQVISEVRPSGTDVQAYAEKVVTQVHNLLAQGVPAEHITVAGFSKGGAIAVLVSSLLDNDRIVARTQTFDRVVARTQTFDRVKIVLIAACGSWLERQPELVPHGRILSLFEASDEMAGSCAVFLERRSEGTTHQEIELDLGGGHGAFYRPNAQWLDPLLAWAACNRDPGT